MRRSTPPAIAFAFAITVLAAACGAEIAPTPPTPPASSAASESASPTPTQVSSPTATEPARLGWRRIGTLDNFRLRGLIGFDDGYVAYGTTYPEGWPGAWFSADGASWAQVELPSEASCPANAQASLDTGAGATNGSAVVLLGVACDGAWMTWASSDGRTWRESVLGPQRGDVNEGRVQAAAGGSWDLFLTGSSMTMRQSTDGVAWGPARDIGSKPSACCFKAGTTSDGTRLLGDHLGWLVRSDDGTSWQDVVPPYRPPSPGGAGNVGTDWLRGIVSPTDADAAPWILHTTRLNDEGDASTWTSFDLETWEEGSVPLDEVLHMTATRFGYVATGVDRCVEEPCPATARQQFRSPDGRAWAALDSSVHAFEITDGPAGVIALGRSPEDVPDLTVWRLDEVQPDDPAPIASDFTQAEANLVLGLRADAQLRCAPKRDGIPEGLEAAVECVLENELVSLVLVYSFPTAEDAAQTYLDRLAEAGVAPLTGSCSASGGDQPTHPGDDVSEAGAPGTIAYGGHVLVTERFGCFLDEAGLANVRVTCGDGTYIAVLGSSSDLAALSGWAAQQAGGQPIAIPGDPGICTGS